MSGPKAPRKIGPKLAMKRDTVQRLGVNPEWLRSAPPAKKWGALRALRELCGAFLLDRDTRLDRLSRPSLVPRVAELLRAVEIAPQALGYKSAEDLAEALLGVIASLELKAGYASMSDAVQKLKHYIHTPRGLLLEDVVDINPLVNGLVKDVEDLYRSWHRLRGRERVSSMPAGHWSHDGYHVGDQTIIAREVVLVDATGKSDQYVDRLHLTPVQPIRPPRAGPFFAPLVAKEVKFPLKKLGEQIEERFNRLNGPGIVALRGTVNGTPLPPIPIENLVWDHQWPAVGVAPHRHLAPGQAIESWVPTPNGSSEFLLIKVGLNKVLFERLFTFVDALQDRLGRP